jgi:hypothetical protein
MKEKNNLPEIFPTIEKAVESAHKHPLNLHQNRVRSFATFTGFWISFETRRWRSFPLLSHPSKGSNACHMFLSTYFVFNKGHTCHIWVDNVRLGILGMLGASRGEIRTLDSKKVEFEKLGVYGGDNHKTHIWVWKIV